VLGEIRLAAGDRLVELGARRRIDIADISKPFGAQQLLADVLRGNANRRDFHQAHRCRFERTLSGKCARREQLVNVGASQVECCRKMVSSRRAPLRGPSWPSRNRVQGAPVLMDNDILCAWACERPRSIGAASGVVASGEKWSLSWHGPHRPGKSGMSLFHPTRQFEPASARVGFGARLRENAGTLCLHATIESKFQSRRIFDA